MNVYFKSWFASVEAVVDVVAVGCVRDALEELDEL